MQMQVQTQVQMHQPDQTPAHRSPQPSDDHLQPQQPEQCSPAEPPPPHQPQQHQTPNQHQPDPPATPPHHQTPTNHPDQTQAKKTDSLTQSLLLVPRDQKLPLHQETDSKAAVHHGPLR